MRLEGEIRSALRTKAASVQVDEEKNWTVIQHGHGERNPSPLVRAGIIGASLVIGLGTLVAVLVSINLAPVDDQGRQPATGASFGSASSVALPESPESIAYGAGDLWVSTISQQDCSSGLLRVSGSTSTLSDDATVPMLIEQMTFAFGSLWAVGVECRGAGGYDGVAARIDPASLGIEVTIDVAPGAVANGIAATDNRIVVAVGQANGNDGLLASIEPSSGAVEQTKRFDGVLGDLQYASGALWAALVQPPLEGTSTGRVVRLEPSSLAIEASTFVDQLGPISAGENAVWVSTLGDQAVSLSSEDLSQLGTPQMISPGGGFAPFDPDDSGVWFLTEDQQGSAELGRLASAGEAIVARLEIGGEPLQAIYVEATDTIWVIDYADRLLRVGAASG